MSIVDDLITAFGLGRPSSVSCEGVDMGSSLRPLRGAGVEEEVAAELGANGWLLALSEVSVV